jgi:hypothetical protein
VRQTLAGMGIEEVLIAPRSPWQSPYVERLIGTIRRDLLDHVIVFNERHLLRLLKGFFDDYSLIRPGVTRRWTATRHGRAPSSRRRRGRLSPWRRSAACTTSTAESADGPRPSPHVDSSADTAFAVRREPRQHASFRRH